MRLKIVHHQVPGRPGRSWAEVVDADTGRRVDFVKSATVTYTAGGVVATVELLDIEVQTVVERPPEQWEGPDL